MVMEGGKGVILGVVNRNSIAFGIAQVCQSQGAEIAITYATEKRKYKLTSLMNDLNNVKCYQCNVNNQKDIKTLKKLLEEEMGEIDFIIHAIAYAPKDSLNNSVININKKSFQIAMNTSVYSLIEIVKELKPILSNSSSILSITYYGSTKCMMNYNLMGIAKASLEMTIKYLAEELGEYGIRVNALSSGPIKTLASKGINNFSFILNWNKKQVPLRRNLYLSDIGKSGMYLVFNLSSGVTGEIHYVDAGYNIMGMPVELNINISDDTLENKEI